MKLRTHMSVLEYSFEPDHVKFADLCRLFLDNANLTCNLAVYYNCTRA